jgi:hypothetical protein
MSVIWLQRIFHTHPHDSTDNLLETSCQVETTSLFWRQIEPGSLKNFAAQLNEGARIARFLRPQFFCSLYL